MGWPSIGVVVPTRNRPELLRAALASIAAQDYPGELRVIVVFDQAEPDLSLAAGDRVKVQANDRTPGLAGARNCGILALDTDLVAFCDDDDEWLPRKLTAQAEAMLADPHAEFASCGIRVRFEGRPAGRPAGQATGRLTDRLAGRSEVTYAELLRSRMVMVHSSTYLIARSSLLAGSDGIGLVDETIPASQNEDWDLALRAARRRPIVHVDEPLVQVRWGPASYYSLRWESKVAGLHWMLDHHPDLAASRPGSARVYAQIAFGYACMRRRRESFRWAVRAFRRNWHERRLPFVLLAASGVVPGKRVLRALHARGHGI
ncbi:MAG TPA: glycosyltransferase [Streptosporangiaceae bacterium]|nr:glycosyltransferase [Streptosporangiaceae bacterium]